MRVSLDPEYRMAFGKALIPLAEDCLNISQRLVDQGHELIRTVRENSEEICSPDEFVLSSKIKVEVAKEKISSCFVHVVETDSASDNYVSPLLEQLREERNRSGYDRKWFKNSSDERWLYEIDPAKKQSRLIYRYAPSERIETIKARESASIELEKQRIFSQIGIPKLKSLKLADIEFYNEFREIADREVFKLGFLPVEKLSKSPHLIQYSRTLTDDMHLRLTLVFSDVMFEARLYLAEKKLGKKFDGNWLEWYSAKSAHEVRMWDIIPWFHYSWCFDFDNLLVNFYAHLSALELMIDRIQAAAMGASDYSYG